MILSLDRIKKNYKQIYKKYTNKSYQFDLFFSPEIFFGMIIKGNSLETSFW